MEPDRILDESRCLVDTDRPSSVDLWLSDSDQADRSTDTGRGRRCHPYQENTRYSPTQQRDLVSSNVQEACVEVASSILLDDLTSRPGQEAASSPHSHQRDLGADPQAVSFPHSHQRAFPEDPHAVTFPHQRALETAPQAVSFPHSHQRASGADPQAVTFPHSHQRSLQDTTRETDGDVSNETCDDSESSGETYSDEESSDEVFTSDHGLTTGPRDVNNNKYNSGSVVLRVRRRKPLTPLRSAERGDPKFQGVTFQLRTCLQKNSSQLCINAYFNCKKLSPRTRLPVRSSFLGSGGEGVGKCTDTEPPPLPKPRRITNHNWGSSGKQCASCNTRKTPLWRDAEDGTPLCNACGIRYKKYRIRCLHCWHIPKKETKADVNCGNCGEQLRLSLFRYKTM